MAFASRPVRGWLAPVSTLGMLPIVQTPGISCLIVIAARFPAVHPHLLDGKATVAEGDTAAVSIAVDTQRDNPHGTAARP